MRRSKLESLTAQAEERKQPPTRLPEGTTLVDLPDHDVQERAEFTAALFEFASAQVKEFVAAGCPPEDDEEVRGHMTFALEMSFATFRGAQEWSKAHGAAVVTAMRKGALEGRREDAPDVVMAALSVDVALEAERKFWAIVREHVPKLAAAERRAEKTGRSRAH